MGCSPSTLAVEKLNRSLRTGDSSEVLQDKLQSSPWLISTATNVLSSTAGTPLHTACERKQVEVVQGMLAFLTSSTLPVVREALQPYCRCHNRALPTTVTEGVRIAVDMVNCKGQTPLMCACAADSPELVKLLLAQGADPWVGDRCGSRTALHYAAMSGSAACIDALIANMSVRDLARGGVRYVNARSVCGITALHYAVFFDHRAAVEELLRHDPQLNASSSSNSYDIFVVCDALSTPLHFAAVRGNAEISALLLKYHVLHASSGRGIASRDPRLRANYGHQLPWQLAATHHPANRELVALLHPGQPLERALGLSSDEEGGFGASRIRSGPSSLADIAAAALRTRLLSELQRLREVQGGAGAEDRGQMSVCGDEGPAGAATPPSVSCPSCPTPTPSTCASQEGEGEGGLCGVCFSEREAVAPRGCGHGVCGECAVRMCRMALGDRRPRPLLCPFCRREVGGFVGLASRPLGESRS